MGNWIPKRGLTHAAVGTETRCGTVRYRLRELPSKAKRAQQERGAEETAYAEVVPRGTLNVEDIAREVATRFDGLSEPGTIYALNAFMTVLQEALQQGRQVTLGGFASFGLSLEGTLDPARPLAAKKLTLRPWARFSQRFITKVNNGARLAFMEALPTNVEIDALVPSPAVILLKGHFRRLETVSVAIVTANGTPVTCTLTAHRPSPTRHESRHARVLPETPLPQGPYTLRLTWPDGAGGESHAEHPFEIP